jgi:hypothetical protein
LSPRNNRRQEANIVAAAVYIAGRPERAAQRLGVSRGQIHRWLAAGTMSHAIYIHVSALARLSGIPTQFLGGEALRDTEFSDSHHVQGSVPSKLKGRSSKSINVLVNPDTRSSVTHPRLRGGEVTDRADRSARLLEHDFERAMNHLSPAAGMARSISVQIDPMDLEGLRWVRSHRFPGGAIKTAIIYPFNDDQNSRPLLRI